MVFRSLLINEFKIIITEFLKEKLQIPLKIIEFFYEPF
jgi:hypothetical protein